MIEGPHGNNQLISIFRESLTNLGISKHFILQLESDFLLISERNPEAVCRDNATDIIDLFL